MYKRSDPIWLPVSNSNSPEEPLTATPILSQSGSVPITISAPLFLAKSIAIFKDAPFSGLGDFTVGNLPSGESCSLTVSHSNPSSFKSKGT